jgi:hypothetical protein
MYSGTLCKSALSSTLARLCEETGIVKPLAWLMNGWSLIVSTL